MLKPTSEERLLTWFMQCIFVCGVIILGYAVDEDNSLRMTGTVHAEEIRDDNAQKTESLSSSDSLLSQNLNGARKVLRPYLIEIMYDSVIPKQNSIVYLIGESHASVSSQFQLAQLLDELIKAQLINAILIEGSKGHIDAEPFLRKISRTLDAQQLNQFWKAQLEWNRIAGYEYVALTRPNTVVVGVENIEAQARYRIASLGIDDDKLELEREFNLQAVKLFEQAKSVLQKRIEHKHIQSIQKNLDDFKKANDEYEDLLAHYRVENADLVRLRQARFELALKEYRLQEILSELAFLDGRIEELRQKYNSYVRILNGKIEKRNQLAIGFESLKSLSQEIEIYSHQYLEPFQEAITKDDQELEELFQKHEYELKDLGSAHKKIEQMDEDILLLKDERSKLLKGLNDVFLVAQDRYFILANQIRDLGAPHSLVFPQIESFFAEKANRLEDYFRQKDRKQELLDRDRGIAANVLKFLSNENNNAVALIVGASHLEGIADQLKANGVSFIGGTLTSVGEKIEHWEIEAWEQRLRNVQLVFAHDHLMKERSRLLDKNWGVEEFAKLEFFRDIQSSEPTRYPTLSGLMGNSEVFEVGSTAVRVGNYFLDKNAEIGDHVVDRGIVPGKQGQFYEVTDRAVARDMVMELSDPETSFIFYRKTGEIGNARYEFSTPKGEKKFDEFMNEFMKDTLLTTEKTQQKRVVMFGEADEIVDHGVVVSPLFNKIRKEFSERDQFNFKLLRTNNARRARETLNKLPHAPTIRMKKITVIKEDDLERMGDILKFTPSFERTGSDDSQIVVFLGRNVPRFRELIQAAGKTKKLKNKIVLLMTCGDAYDRSANMVEDLLRQEVATVMSINRQITPQIGERLLQEFQEAVIQANERNSSLDVHDLFRSALQNWKKKDPAVPERKALEQTDFWVENALPDEGREVVIKKSA